MVVHFIFENKNADSTKRIKYRLRRSFENDYYFNNQTDPSGWNTIGSRIIQDGVIVEQIEGLDPNTEYVIELNNGTVTQTSVFDTQEIYPGLGEGYVDRIHYVNLEDKEIIISKLEKLSQ
mgnify:CR=1 FL=1